MSESPPWAARLGPEDARGARVLRVQDGIEGAYEGDVLWLRGPALDPALETRLRCIAGLERFVLREPDLLVRGGTLGRGEVLPKVPVLRLPDLVWRPLGELIEIHKPPAQLATARTQRVPVTLVKGGREQPAAALLLPLATLREWTEAAPRVRLEPLLFVVSESGRAIVRGAPLPPVAGQPLWETTRVLLPTGATVDPPLPRSELRPALAPTAPDDAWILFDDGGVGIIPEAAWTGLSRGAVRATVEGMGGAS